jgi:hypothetical protein
LFEFGQTGRLADKQKLAMRVIRGTSVYKVPWARRGTLEGHLDKVLREEANKRGTGTSEMRAAFVKAEESGESAQLILKALEAMAISDQRDTELALAKRKVQELEDALSRTPKIRK